MGSGAPTAGAEIQEKMVRENREGGRRRKAAGEGEGLDREGRGGGKGEGERSRWECGRGGCGRIQKVGVGGEIDCEFRNSRLTVDSAFRTLEPQPQIRRNPALI